MEVYQHVLNKVMDILNEYEIESYSKWMTYRCYENITHLCVDFYYILDHIHDYRVDGSKYAIKFGNHEQAQVARELDVNKHERQHF